MLGSGSLIIRGMALGPLFQCRNGSYLTWQVFVREVRQALEIAGVDQSLYTGHSLCIGVATIVAAKGIEESVIKTLRR